MFCLTRTRADPSRAPHLCRKRSTSRSKRRAPSWTDNHAAERDPLRHRRTPGNGAPERPLWGSPDTDAEPSPADAENAHNNLENRSHSRRSALRAVPHAARRRQAAVRRVRSEEFPKLARWNRGSMSTSGSTFETCGYRDPQVLSIPYFIPSTGATVGDGQGRSATEDPGSEPVRGGQGRSETALNRLSMRMPRTQQTSGNSHMNRRAASRAAADQLVPDALRSAARVEVLAATANMRRSFCALLTKPRSVESAGQSAQNANAVVTSSSVDIRAPRSLAVLWSPSASTSRRA